MKGAHFESPIFFAELFSYSVRVVFGRTGGSGSFRKGGPELARRDWSPKSTAMFSRPGPSCLEGPDVIRVRYSKAARREAP